MHDRLTAIHAEAKAAPRLTRPVWPTPPKGSTLSGWEMRCLHPYASNARLTQDHPFGLICLAPVTLVVQVPSAHPCRSTCPSSALD